MVKKGIDSKKLLTATGNMNLLAEVCLDISIGTLECSQEFFVTTPLVEDCILGVDFLARNQVYLDFNRKVVSGPRIGTIEMSDRNKGEGVHSNCKMGSFNNNNNIHLYSADSILICSSALYNSIKVGVCYVCTYVCVCMLVRYVCICIEINLISIYLSGCVVRDTEKMSFQEFFEEKK